jgi:hypothetical protein
MAKMMGLLPLSSKPEYKQIQERLREETDL